MANTTREQRREEAIKRIKMLNMHENVLRDFTEEDKLNKSEWMGALYWLTDPEKRIVKRFEKEHNATVYTAIFSNTNIGAMLALLYVSDYPEEWEMDRQDIKEGYPIAWVENLDYPDCSELGSIGVRPMFGGLVRTA